jgi:hypothetical protein
LLNEIWETGATTTMKKIKKGAKATRARNKNVARSTLSQERLQAMRQGMRQSQSKRWQVEQLLRDRSHNENNKADSTAGALKLRAACEYLGGIHSATLRRLIARGLIRPNRMFRHLLFPVKELDRAIREGMV